MLRNILASDFRLSDVFRQLSPVCVVCFISLNFDLIFKTNNLLRTVSNTGYRITGTRFHGLFNKEEQDDCTAFASQLMRCNIIEIFD